MTTTTGTGIEMNKREGVHFSVFPAFARTFKGQTYDSPCPPPRLFHNNRSCKPFTEFVRCTLLDHLNTWTISLIGRLGCDPLPHLVLPLTIELNKPRLCHDACFLNLWIVDHLFKLVVITCSSLV